ncbi:VWA domain-containing protein [Rhodobacteraceae bacterium NNCM2]|nr:VWA domain-containing protein [Coraliihabitans acroporae]
MTPGTSDQHQAPTGSGLPTPDRRVIQRLIGFSALLRANGFAVSPDQTMDFIAGIGLLGPRSVEDIRRAAIALLSIPHDREEEFHSLFDAWFLGQTLPAAMPGEDEDVEAHEDDGASSEADLGDEAPPGLEATVTERLGHRALADLDDLALADLTRRAPARLPRRQSYRRVPARHGRVLDMRRTLRDAARRDGEVLSLSHRRRKLRQRRVVLMIDVSGSMAERTEASLRLAHALARGAERFEAFTLGTRLTRITPAIRLRQRDRALERSAALIADIDGGTRIGEALGAFLAIPRFAGFARGASVVVLSDGLERGTPDALIEATRRLSRLAWRIDWLTPLADDRFEPRTEALSAILPHIDALGDGRSTEAISTHILNITRSA